MARLRAENARLRAKVRALTAAQAQRAGGVPAADVIPKLPQPDADGNYPAAEALDVLVARHIIRRRHAVGWTQIELARRAGVRQETVSRIESGKHTPNVATVDRLDRALKRAGG
jgi:ribosome-binding protein aMBF1 (putative translation factor)